MRVHGSGFREAVGIDTCAATRSAAPPTTRSRPRTRAGGLQPAAERPGAAWRHAQRQAGRKVMKLSLLPSTSPARVRVRARARARV